MSQKKYKICYTNFKKYKIYYKIFKKSMKGGMNNLIADDQEITFEFKNFNFRTTWKNASLSSFINNIKDNLIVDNYNISITTDENPGNIEIIYHFIFNNFCIKFRDYGIINIDFNKKKIQSDDTLAIIFIQNIWIVEFLKEFADLSEYLQIEIIDLANFFGINPLIDILTLYIAFQIKSSTPEKIKKKFGTENRTFTLHDQINFLIKDSKSSLSDFPNINYLMM